MTEDVMVIGGLWAELHSPVLFLGVFVLVAIWLMPKIWRGLKRVASWLRSKFGGADPEPPIAEPLAL